MAVGSSLLLFLALDTMYILHAFSILDLKYGIVILSKGSALVAMHGWWL